MIVGGSSFDGNGRDGRDSVTYINKYMSNCNVNPYPSKVSASAAANDIVCGGRIFDKIGSRFDDISITNKCWKLNPTGDWNEFKSMARERAYHTLTRVGDFIFAIGGWGYTHSYLKMTNDKFQFNSYRPLRTVERFPINNMEGNWTFMSQMGPTVRHHCTVALNDSFLMVIGGAMSNQVFTNCILTDIVKKGEVLFKFCNF